MQKQKNQKTATARDMVSGFTLIELLVVIAIIGLLSSVVFASLNSARAKARNATKMSELQQVARALELYYHDNNTYPPHKNGSSWCRIGTSYSAGVCLVELTSGGYLPSLPTSPNADPYYYYNYGSYVMVSSRLEPPQYNPGGPGGWHCSDASGGNGSSKYWCLNLRR